MINETVILLTYYYNQEDRNHRLLRHIITRDYCPAYIPWDIYLYEPLRKIFSKVILYDYLKRRAEIGLSAMNEEIISLARKEKVGYVLWTSFHWDVLGSTLDTLRNDGAIVVGFFFDDEMRFDSYTRYWLPYLDYSATNSAEAVPKYQALNARATHIVPNTGIAIDRDWSKIEEKYDISFVGSINFVDRRHFIDAIRARNLPIHIFGEGSSGYVTFEQMIDIFQTSKINLNFSKVGSYHQARQLKGRMFQVCMAGGFMLTESVPDIEQYFAPDKEVACFDGEDEMLQKIAYYLDHEAERRAIARAGWEKAVKEYTSDSLIAKVFRHIQKDFSTREENGAQSSRPPKLAMPLLTRTVHPAHYHFRWGKALLEENYPKDRWQNTLKRSLSYSPLHLGAWYYYLTGLLPGFIRPAFFKVYAAIARLQKSVFSGLRSVPYLNIIFRSLIKRIV